MREILKQMHEAYRRNISHNNDAVRAAFAAEVLGPAIELPPFEVFEMAEQLAEAQLDISW